MNAPKLKRRRNAYKARAVKLRKEIEDLISKGEEACNIEHKCQQLKEQLRTIKEVSENICDILDSDEEAAAFMEETYQFTDDCDDLIMTASKKNDKTAAEKAKKDEECTVRGIKQPELPVFEGNPAKFEDWEAIFDAFIGNIGMDPKLKMLYLKNSLAGEALKLVEGYRPSETGYEKARDQLTDKYGGKTRRIRHELSEIRHLSNIAEGDTRSLEQFADRVTCLVTSLKENGSVDDMSDVSAYYILVAEKLHHTYIKNYQRWLKTSACKDSFETFAEWLAEEARCEKRAKEITKTEDEPKLVRQRNGGRRTYATSKTSKPREGNQTQPSCFVCQGCHMLQDCAKFQSWDVSKRYGFCKSERICFRCLSGRHRGATCKTFPGCNADGCGGSHHTLLHARQQQRQQSVPQQSHTAPWQNPTEVKEFCPSQHSGAKGMVSASGDALRNPTDPSSSYSTAASEPETVRGKIAFQTAPVIVQYKNRSVILNALLDPCSDASFITESAASELKFNGEEQVLQLGTVNGREDVTMKTGVVELSSLHSTYAAPVNVHVIPSLDSASVRTDWNIVKERWPHLKTVPFPRMRSKSVDILIGLCAETTPLFVPLKTVKGAESEPVAVLTPLGWTAFGAIEEESIRAGSSGLKMKKNMTNFSRTLRTHISRKTCDEELQVIKSMTDLEVIHVRKSEESLMSHEEQEALKKVSESLSYDGQRYQVAVPWRDGGPQLTSNFNAAMQRLVRLEQSLKRRGGELPVKYGDILEQYVKKGYMTKISVSERTDVSEKEWFLPHFPVIRDEKESTKVRIVYDAAAKHRGVSLNSRVLPGPSLYTDLVETLLGFRLHRVALIGDVCEMFLQVELAPDDRKYHRVLWRDMKNEEPTVYQANRWLFGNAAAPFVAQFVLKENARKHAEKYSLGSEMLMRHFYMDDGIQSFRTEQEAIEARKQVSSVLQDGGMKIKKWMSNNMNVLRAIPVEDRAISSRHFFEDQGPVPTKTLGVVWTADDDQLSIDISKRGKLTENLTKRTCLREMASVFDPLGLFVPLTIRAKMLFQQTWTSGVDWDDVLPYAQQLQWSAWFADLQQLNSLSVPRCVHPFPEVDEQEIHVFSDASQEAYGTAIYVVSKKGDERSSQLALARARVAPQAKTQTIPRLELMGALLGLRLVKALCSTMESKIEDVHFWSDSMDVLCWIRNEVRRFQPFVAHRISEIRELTRPEQWQHVPGADNPADAPTRGLSLTDLKESQLWWEGPKFLLGDGSTWPLKKQFAMEDYDQSELKKDQQKNVFAIRAPSAPSWRLNPANFSSWTRLLRVTAWVQRFIRVLREKISATSDDLPDGELSPDEIKEAEKFWVQQAQKDSFQDEVEQLQKAKMSGARPRKTCRRSTVKQLSPFLDEDGIIRVGGRLQQSGLEFEVRHPMLLPKNHAVSKLVIQHVHSEAEHGIGIEHTLAELRTRFWIPSARKMIKSCVRLCVTCQRLRKKPETQEMAPMISAQVQPSLRAFDRCAVDYAGPFWTKQGRGKTRQKRYLCIFVCLQTKAVHLEMAYSLDTASFIRALMRFISRRGRPTEIRSDNGRNFVRAAKELKRNVQELDGDEIQRELSKCRTKWIFNPPGAPHFNGICEALVKVAKKALMKTLERADLTDEELLTAFCRAEGLLNTRPLTAVSSDPNDQAPLTPGDFITGPSRVDMTPSAGADGCSLRQRWRRLQQLNTEFWRRWVREYLPTLQARRKWTEVRRNLQEGEVVLLLDPNVPRGTWPMARVEKTYPGQDGLVRVVDVKTSKGLFKRPVTKIVRLEMDQ